MGGEDVAWDARVAPYAVGEREPLRLMVVVGGQEREKQGTEQDTHTHERRKSRLKPSGS